MNLFSVDLEDWYSPRTIKGFASLDWESCESYIQKPTNTLLELLDKHSIKAVFFVLGYVAARHPDLIRRIADSGHEIASHGYSHFLLTKLNEQEFSDDIEKSLEVLAKIGIRSVRGYRAPSFSIIESTLFAIDILKKFGFQYSSSIYPTNLHPEYGLKDFGTEIFRYENGLIEIPLNKVNLFGTQIPCSGGAYLRFFPYSSFKMMARQSIEQSNHYMFYIHPWELAIDQPRIKSNFLGRIRHYYNIGSVQSKLERLLNDIQFDNFPEFIDGLLRAK